MAFGNFLYNNVMLEYERIRLKKKKELDKRKEEVYAKIPRIKELDDIPSSISLEKFKEYMLKKDEKVFDKAKKEIKKISKEKETLLVSNGFRKNYLDLEYECSNCKDTGYIENKRCNCFNQKLIFILYEKSNLKKILEKENFDTFDLTRFDNKIIVDKINTTSREYMKKVFAYAKNYVDKFEYLRENDIYNILLLGKTGVGKTFVANCIAKALIEKMKFVIYLNSNELFEHLRKAKLNRDNTEEYYLAMQISSYIEEADLLIIDDLGSELISTFVSSELFRIINYRLNTKKATIISTNLSMNEIKDNYTERVSSRLISLYKAIYLHGEDIRTK